MSDRVDFYKEDPEAQYRAGFEEGALALYQMARPFLSVEMQSDLQSWFDSMDAWRTEARQAVATGQKPHRKHPPRMPQSN